MSFGDLKLHGHFDNLYLGVHQSGPETSSTANHIFYRALGGHHDPYFKQPLTHQIVGQCTVGHEYMGIEVNCKVPKWEEVGVSNPTSNW